jgi:hypothetical protein
MASSRTRARKLRDAAARVLTSPILLDGDADGLLGLLRYGTHHSGLPAADYASLRRSRSEPAAIAVLVVDGDGRRSALARASQMLRAMEPAIERDAVRILVVQSGRSRVGPARLRDAVGAEILFQITLAVDASPPRPHSRSFRQHLGLLVLNVAGIRVIRLG